MNRREILKLLPGLSALPLVPQLLEDERVIYPVKFEDKGLAEIHRMSSSVYIGEMDEMASCRGCTHIHITKDTELEYCYAGLEEYEYATHVHKETFPAGITLWNKHEFGLSCVRIVNPGGEMIIHWNVTPPTFVLESYD